MSEPLSYADWKAQKEKPLAYAEWKATQKELPPVNRFLNGVGGKVLDAASGVAELLPGVSDQNPIAQAAQGGLSKSRGIAGEAGKLVGGAVPYMALPEGIIPSALAAAGIGAATGHGGIEYRARTGAISGGTQAVAGAAIPAISQLGRMTGHVIGDLGTHTGGETIKDAARAGYTGGDKLNTLLDNMRGKVSQTAIIDMEKKALGNLAKNDRSAYTNAINAVKQDQTVLNFLPIQKAVDDSMNISRFNGHSINPDAASVQSKVANAIDEWSGKGIPGASKFNINTNQWETPIVPGVDVNKFHTIEGLDALKKKIGNIREGTEFGSPDRAVANQVYTSIKDAIVAQSPAYAKVMKDSSNAIKLRKEITKELSLGENALDSTALRKSLAIPRNNANTNYGQRESLAKILESNGAENLMTALNGQALNSWKPRGLGSLVASGIGGAGVATGSPVAIPLMMTQSPRLMGEVAVKAGQSTKLLEKSLALKGVKPAIISAILQQQEQK